MVRVAAAAAAFLFGALLSSPVLAEPIPLEARAGGPKVDLGYSIYEGSYDANSKLNTFKGYIISLFAPLMPAPPFLMHFRSSLANCAPAFAMPHLQWARSAGNHQKSHP